MTTYERRLAMTAMLGILFVGLYAGWCIYQGYWNTLSLLIILGAWMGMCIGQVRLTGMYRVHAKAMTEKWLKVSKEHELAVQWNRYMWSELTAIGGHVNGYTVPGSLFTDPPGPEAGEVIPPEGSAGGS